MRMERYKLNGQFNLGLGLNWGSLTDPLFQRTELSFVVGPFVLRLIWPHRKP